ncbi:PQQ-binding-like beta-propeller repeat protein [Streptomyces sp. NBC_01481]|uniref:outer membrane protein assembly factor BamB family protein n=1 Tax=Streptomyces sp. NBC_01481 TaxID=2975869 RepID=UPI00338E0DF8
MRHRHGKRPGPVAYGHVLALHARPEARRSLPEHTGRRGGLRSRGRLHAHAAADGRRTWTATTAPYARDEVVPYGGTILLSSGDSYRGEDGRREWDNRPGYVLAHSARTGRALWRQNREQPSWTPPVPAGRLALVGHDTAWWAYDIATGEPRWRLACDGALADDPVMRDGMLYGPNTEGVRAVRL